MRSRAYVLIIADDLSGAADSGVPFALRGMRTEVLLAGTASPGARVVVLDTDSRRLPATAAGATVREAVRAHGAGRLIYKKIDSTLRGNLAAELGALPGPVVVCPASPATGRTVVNGIVHIDDVPLPQTCAWAAEPGPAPATIAEALAPLRTRTVDLATVRAPRDELRTTIATALDTASGSDAVVVCDAVTEADLHAIAQACLDLPVNLAGAAGLARALAGSLPPAPPAPAESQATPRVPGRALVVVGSANAVSHAQAEHLAGTFPHAVRVAAHELLDRAARTGLAARLAELTTAGDTVVSVAGPVTTASRELGAALGEAVAAAARHAGLLVLTGGETARAVLTRLGAGAIELLAEPEPGVVLGRASSGRATGVHVLTKAGGFGRAATLDLAIQAVRKGHP